MRISHLLTCVSLFVMIDMGTLLARDDNLINNKKTSYDKSKIDKKKKDTMITIKKLPLTEDIKAWTVINRELPLISISIGFENAGTKANTKLGVAQVLTQMLQEGCGPWSSQQFKEYLLEHNIELDIVSDNDNIMVLIRISPDQIDAAFSMLHHLFKNPRFNERDLARVKMQIQGSVTQQLYDEQVVAQQAVAAFVLGDHPYNQPLTKLLEILPSITKKDLEDSLHKSLCQDNIKITVIGDFENKSMTEGLKTIIEGLPKSNSLKPVANLVPQNLGKMKHLPMDIPQSIICCIQDGLPISHPDFYALFILNSILSGLSLNSKLWHEIRETRGLAYYVQSAIKIQQQANLWFINTATGTDKVEEVLKIIDTQLDKVKNGDLTAEELDFHRSNIKGDYPLAFDKTTSMAMLLLRYQLDHRDIDYVNKRNGYFDAITLDDLKRVAKKWIKKPAVIVVGRSNDDNKKANIAKKIVDAPDPMIHTQLISEDNIKDDDKDQIDTKEIIRAIPVHLFKPETAKLDNDLEIVVVTNTLAPTVAVGILYKYGSCDDPADQIGIAHFLEHLMFKGTKKYPIGEFDKIILKLGGRTNAWTSYDQTFYHTQIAQEHMEKIIELEADRMHNLIFDAKEVKSEQQVVMQERLMRLDNHPFGQAYEAQLKSVFWYNPYGTPVIGYPHHINNYDYDSVRKMYEKWYAPNNAVMVIVGNTTMEKVLPLVKKYFSNLAKKTIPKRVRPQEPDHQGITQSIRQDNPRNSLVIFEWMYASPNHTQGLKQHYYPLQVLAHIIGGTYTRHLHKLLVEEKKLALSVDCHYEQATFDPFYFSVGVTLAPGANEKEVRNIIANYLNDLVNKGVNEREFQKAKRDLIFEAMFVRDGNSASLESFAQLAVGFTPDEIDKWSFMIDAVTKEQVNEAARDVLSKKPVAVLELYPPKEEKSLKEEKS